MQAIIVKLSLTSIKGNVAVYSQYACSLTFDEYINRYIMNEDNYYEQTRCTERT